MQHSQERLRALAKRHGDNQKTIAKWGRRQRPQGGNRRTSTADLPTGPKVARFTVLSIEKEAVIIAFRRHTLLPVFDGTVSNFVRVADYRHQMTNL